MYFFKHIIIKIAPDIVSQNDVYSVCHIFFQKNESRIFRYNSALFIDSKINQLLVTQCNLWVGVLGWIRDLEWCPIEAVLDGSSLGQKKFSWSNSNFTQF